MVKYTSTAQYQIQAATTVDEVEKLRPFWLKMNRHPDADIDFFSLFVAISSNVLKPYVLVVNEDEQPVAMLIGRLENSTVPIKAGYYSLFGFPIRQLTFLQEGFVGDC